jgi:hypothetical protein
MQKKTHTTHLTIDNVEQIDFCGKPIFYLSVQDVYSRPTPIKPTNGKKHNHKKCEGCQKTLKHQEESLMARYTGMTGKRPFPNCCKQHEKASKHPEFRKEHFDKVPLWTAQKIVYTYEHIINFMDSDDWYKEVTDYIEYAVMSFGQMPENGEPLYVSAYFDCVVALFGRFEKMTTEDKLRRDAILDYIKKLRSPVDKSKQTDLNILIGYYQKWLNFFPFELHSYFGDLKKHFEKSIMVLSKAPEVNKYLGMARAQLHTKKSLQIAMLKVTEELLTKVSGDKLFKKGVVKDVDKLEIDLIVQERQQELKDGYLNNAEKSDKRYRTAIKNWLNDEQSFWKKMNPYLKALQVKNELTKEQKLSNKLKPIGFFELEKVKSLSAKGQISLVELIAEKQIPYAIAMLNYLGFIEHLTKNHYSSKVKLNKEVAKILVTADRNIKGNINVLSSASRENRTRYTAHEHQKQVQKDYEKLK